MGLIIESQESSSPMITRAVAAGLSHAKFTGYEFSALEKMGLQVVGLFPQSLARWLIPRVQGGTALNPGDVYHLRTDDLIQARLADYSRVDGKFPAVVIGVGMGGATTHLSLGLQAPFLPQAFVMTLKNGSIDGNVQRYLNLSKDLAKRITDHNPDVMSIQHYDPIHDGWLVRWVNHLRLKLIDLPEAYKQFIRSKVIPGGEVVYLEGNATWLRYQIAEKNVFQVGGWGDISPDEFLNGSDRISAYCRKAGITDQNWRLDDYPLVEGPESEWGSEPGLKEALESFCQKEGYPFTGIRFQDPNDFSRLAFYAISEQFKESEIEPNGIIVETFSQYDPAAVIQYGLLPIWLIFNTNDSLRYLQSMRKVFVPGKPILFSPLSTFSLTPDMVKWQDWEDCLKGFTTVNIGTRKNHYPADTLALIHWQQKLHQWGEKHLIPPALPITGMRLSQIAQRLTSEIPAE